MQLNAFAAEPGVVEDETAATHVSGAAQRRRGQVLLANRPEHSKVSVAQVESSERNRQLRIPHPIEDHQSICTGRCFDHPDLELVVEPGVHQLERQSYSMGSG